MLFRLRTGWTMMEKENIVKLATPSAFFEDWNALNSQKCIMVCHDQDIDRRILQEAEALEKLDIKILIIALSQNNDDTLEKIGNLYIHRISLAKIIPDCPAYWHYQKWHYRIGGSSKFGTKIKNKLHKVNWQIYKLLLLSLYRSPTINNPMPFDFCFKEALNCYDADIIFAHDLPALKASCDRAQELGIPIFYDSHEYYHQQKVFSRYQKKIMIKREDEYLKKCDRVITINETFAENFDRRAGQKKSFVIFNCHKLHRIKKNHSLHDMIGKKKSERIILFQGGALKNRNVETLVEGFSLLKKEKVNLVFMGPFDPKLREQFIQKYNEIYKKSLFFLDSIPQDKLLDVTSTATFGVIPYRPCDFNTLYCTPNKFFEFIQAELPILYNSELLELSKLAKKLRGAGFGYDLSTPKKVKQAFEKMLARNLKADKVALAKAKDRFSWEHEEKTIIKEVIRTLRTTNKIKEAA